jgi:hypothetical protein
MGPRPSVVWGAVAYTFTWEEIGTSYMIIGIRTVVDPTNPEE